MRNAFCKKCGINLNFNPAHVCPTTLAASALPTGYDDRKNDFPLWDFQFGYFPLAWLEVVKVAVVGNKQHNPGEPLHWARGKSMDQLNTAARHQFDYGMGQKKDTDGCYHLAKAIWRLSARLQLDIEAERDAGRQSQSAGESPAEPVPPAAVARVAGAKRNGRTSSGLRRRVHGDAVRHRDKAARR